MAAQAGADERQLAMALIACTLVCGALLPICIFLLSRRMIAQASWRTPVALLTPLLLLHTALLGHDTWLSLKDGDKLPMISWESPVYLAVLLATMVVSHSYLSHQLYDVTQSRIVVTFQAALILAYIGAGVALGVLSWGQAPATMTSSIDQVVPTGILLMAPTLLLLSNLILIQMNLPRSVHRLEPAILRYSIVALETTIVPLLLSAATVALFFALPNSHIWLTLRMVWPAVYQLNMVLCLLCKTNPLWALFSQSSFRNRDSFGNDQSLEENIEKGVWNFKANSIFRPKSRAGSSSLRADLGNKAPQQHAGYLRVDEPGLDDVSVYSGTTSSPFSGPSSEPISRPFSYMAPISAYMMQPENQVPPRPARMQGDTLRFANPDVKHR